VVAPCLGCASVLRIQEGGALQTDDRSMRAAYRDVVAIRDARTLITASAVSQLGDWLYNAALLGYVYGATRSAGWVGAATIVRLLPYVLLGPLGGAVADRFSRRTVLLVGDVARVVLMAALAVVVATHGPVVAALALTAVSSAAGGAERPAAMAWLPRLVGESRLGPANALLHTAQDLGTVLGPVVGALLLAVTSPWIAFAANGMTFAVSALLIGSIRPDRRPARSAARGHGAIRHGVRAARATPFVAALFCVVAMVELTYGAQTVQLVIYARRSLGLGAGGRDQRPAGDASTGVGRGRRGRAGDVPDPTRLRGLRGGWTGDHRRGDRGARARHLRGGNRDAARADRPP
jgi:MFS family permease